MKQPTCESCCQLAEQTLQQLRAMNAILIAIQSGKPVDLNIVLGLEPAKGTDHGSPEPPKG